MKCRICDSEDLVPVLDLGLQPWGNHFLTKDKVGKEPEYPLFVEYCRKCSCAQLNYTVPKEVMFSDHTYLSGTTRTLRQHFAETARFVDTAYCAGKPSKSVLDIGSNDGTQLEEYIKLGYEALGVESCGSIAKQAQSKGVPTVSEFFNEECAKKLDRTFDIINASGVFFHLEELHSAARGVRRCLKQQGVFIVQFLYMKSIIENLAFDQIYHEHLLYYTLKTIETLLKRHKLEPFDACVSPIHGGSVILSVGHPGIYDKTGRYMDLYHKEQESRVNELETYRSFSERVTKMRTDTIAYLDSKKAEGKVIFGFGAPVKGNTFLNYCGIGTQYLDCLVEKNPLRKGLYSPGMHIPIVLENEIEKQPDVYLVLAWNFKEEILKNNQALIDEGVEFYFPVNPGQ